jgi:hypothetical protein
MRIEEEVGYWSNRFHRLCRGCSLGLGLVVGRFGRMGVEGVYGVQIFSAVA